MYALQKLTSTISISDVRAINRAAVLERIRVSGPISRTELAADLRISLPTVIRIVDELIAGTLVRPADHRAWSGGRKPELVEFNGAAHLIIGIDLGGTKIYGAVADLNGDILHEMHFQHNQSRADESFQVVCQSIQNLLDYAQNTRLPIHGISVGVPGITHAETGLVENAPGLDWRAFPLRARLSEHFSYPLVIENDVNLAALGEFWFGTEPGIENLVLLAIGTGIGAGLVIHGEVYSGAHDTAGEVGYLLPEPGCLRSAYPDFGAFEQLASGSGIAARAREILQNQQSSARPSARPSAGMQPAPPDPLTAEAVFQAARANAPWARAVLDETIDYLAQAIASIALVIDPDVILLGGGVSRSADLLISPIQERLAGVIPIRPNLAVSRLGYRAGVLGGVARLLRTTLLPGPAV